MIAHCKIVPKEKRIFLKPKWSVLKPQK